MKLSFAFFFIRTKIRSKALIRWKKRFSEFSRDPPEETVEEIEKSLKLARVTIVESKLMSAILMMKHDKEESKRLINTEIHPESLRMAQISPLKDLNRCLWSSASQVLKNSPSKLP